MKHVEKHGEIFLVQIPKTKTKNPRSFTITGSFVGIVQKYINLRPGDLELPIIRKVNAPDSSSEKTNFQTHLVELQSICLCQNRIATQVLS